MLKSYILPMTLAFATAFASASAEESRSWRNLLGLLGSSSNENLVGSLSLEEWTTPQAQKLFAKRAIVGREDYVDRIFGQLQDPEKPNVILVGRAGSGKTALVQRLSVKLLHENKRLFKLGPFYSGRNKASAPVPGGSVHLMLRALEELNRAVLFVDDGDTFINKWREDAWRPIAENVMSGHIPVILAMTEFNPESIEPAVRRRFHVIEVEEPTGALLLKILEARTGPDSELAQYYDVTFEDEAISEAIRLAKQSGSEFASPDKELDILGRAAREVQAGGAPDVIADVRLSQEIASLDFQMRTAEKIGGNYSELEIARLKKQKERKLKEKFELRTRAIKIEQLIGEIRHIKGRFARGVSKTPFLLGELDRLYAELKAMNVNYGVVSAETVRRVSLQGLLQMDQEDIDSFKSYLTEVVGDRGRATEAIADELSLNVLGLTRFGPSAGAHMIFIGADSSTRKSTIRAINRFFGIEKTPELEWDLSRLSVEDMLSSDSTVLGCVKRYPKSVLLVRNLDMAQVPVADVFLDILQTGELKDSRGHLVDFRSVSFVFSFKSLPNLSPEMDSSDENLRKWLEDSFRFRMGMGHNSNEGLAYEGSALELAIKRARPVVFDTNLGPGEFTKTLLDHVGQLNEDLKSSNRGVIVNMDSETAHQIYALKNEKGVQDAADRITDALKTGFIENWIEAGDVLDVQVDEHGQIELRKRPRAICEQALINPESN